MKPAPLLDRLARAPRAMQIGLLVAVGAALLGLLFAVAARGGAGGGPGRAVAVLVAGVAIVGLLLLAYRELLKASLSRRSVPLEEALRSSAAVGPVAISEPARRARLDDLRRNFESGVQKFREAGKSLYALPWYLLVGEPGSGKTEAIRRCNIGFPPGLQDQLQGAGGTLNMNWWFTNHAVILDTAGRLMFEEVEPGSTGEWQEFLKLVRRARPDGPVNGMLLVIPAESLIKDPAEEIEARGGRIARQLDNIQRTLGVRFPVYVVITKCDLINGFREFFDGINDPALQHQIMGWSNPAPLDAKFEPERVERHLVTVKERLVRRRMGLLRDPVHTQDPRARRTDQVDALYEFPEAFMAVAPRLRRYLETIFAAGEWSPKPLFLRGIYFTSSMREGEALDAILAEALGVGVESLPEGRVWDRERAYFLRDLFTAKVFRERGLVTRAGNTSAYLRMRHVAVYGGAAAGALFIAGAGVLAYSALAQSVAGPAGFWSGIGEEMRAGLYGPGEARLHAGSAPSGPWALPVVGYADSERCYIYLGDQAVTAVRVPSPHAPTLAGLWEAIGDDCRSAIEARARGAEARLESARMLFLAGVVRPLFDATRSQLRADISNGSQPAGAESTKRAMNQLRKFATPHGPGPASDVAVPELAALIEYLFARPPITGDMLDAARADAPALQATFQYLFVGSGPGGWPPAPDAIGRVTHEELDAWEKAMVNGARGKP